MVRAPSRAVLAAARGSRPAILAVLAIALASGVRAVTPDAEPRPARAAPLSATAWRLLSLDHPTAAATLAWIDVVRRYGAQPDDGSWLPPMLAPIGALDPAWKTPWVYGSLMARALGDVDAHAQILHQAMAVHPAEPWFPYALGMSRYLDHADPEGAAGWLEHAASLPGAPEVHRRAAEALRQLP